MINDNLIEVRDLSFDYVTGTEDARERALDNVNLTFKAGEFAVITGPSGCGKSTLCKCLVGLIPHAAEGIMSGDVVVAGLNTRDHAPQQLASYITLAFQSPDDQLFSNGVEADVAFGPEHLGLNMIEIDERISRALGSTGAEAFRHRLIDELSGGEKQRVAIASSMALEPDILVLDEPTSELDPASAFGLIDTLKRLNVENGTTIILIEHRLERLVGIMDRLIVLDHGKVAFDGLPDEVFNYDLPAMGIMEPPTISFRKRFGKPGPGDRWKALYAADPLTRGDPTISMRNVYFSYPRSGSRALMDISLDIYRGEVTMIMGANGSGKTTLVKHLNGLLRPDSGHVAVDGKDISRERTAAIARKVGIVFQSPSHQLFAETVFDELAFGPGNLGMGPDVVKESVDDAARSLGLSASLSRSPFMLSGGEKQRVAIGSIISMSPSTIVLDEPTLGLNYGLKEDLARLLKGLKMSGHAVIVVTHDVEFAAAHADRVVVMSGGRIIKDGSPREALTSEAVVASASLHLPQATIVGKSLGLEGILRVDEICREGEGDHVPADQ